MAQTDRDILFSNEAFVIGMLQAVSGAGFAAAVSQSQALINLSGMTAFLLLLTSMAVALMVAMLAAYCKHQYKLWDVKAQVSVSKNESEEAQLRSKKANKYLEAMRIALVIALIAILFGVAALLVTAWIRDTSGAAQSLQGTGSSLGVLKTEPGSLPTSANPAPSATHDNWQRMKDCAEQTDRILKRSHLEDGQTIGNGDSIGFSENHYSVKYERCFVQVHITTSLQVMRSLQGDLKKSTPPSYWKLYDAFEGKDLSTCTYSQVENFCVVGGSPGDCSECRKFATERIQN